MKLKDGLVLREVAGQYVIVPTGKRVREVTSIVYISSSGAYLWDYMKENEFEKEDLVERILEHYDDADREETTKDIDNFVETLIRHSIIDDGKKRGHVIIRAQRIRKEDLGESGI